MKILGIETSCDETAAAVVTGKGDILSNVIFSQIQEHQPYGGVVPEIASRSHISHIDNIVTQAMNDAKCSFDELEAIAVTQGPGLIGGVIVGVMMAKAISAASGKKLIGINHLEGHALSARISEDIEFPFLLLLLSGGHCQILSVEGVGRYKLLGATLDDALGEAFDKVAKMLGLGYPGGAVVEKLALLGDDKSFKFPKPLVNRAGCDFSFSGLKTAVFRTIEAHENRNQQFIYNICASFQKTCGDILENRLINAIEIFRNSHPEAKDIVIAGGVAANKYLKNRLGLLADKYNFKLSVAPMDLCTDNAVMIAWAGVERLKAGYAPDDLTIAPKARWKLY